MKKRGFAFLTGMVQASPPYTCRCGENAALFDAPFIGEDD